jgi:hypothetical protein
MDLGKVVSELKRERDRLDKAIAALEGLDGAVAATAKAAAKPAAGVKKAKHYISPEGRKRLSEMMKKRWAERRRKLGSGHRQSAKAA